MGGIREEEEEVFAFLPLNASLAVEQCWSWPSARGTSTGLLWNIDKSPWFVIKPFSMAV